jgi:hypothetical protein
MCSVAVQRGVCAGGGLPPTTLSPLSSDGARVCPPLHSPAAGRRGCELLQITPHGSCSCSDHEESVRCGGACMRVEHGAV